MMAKTLILPILLALCLEAKAEKDAFAMPFQQLTREQKREFSTGNVFFNENWVAAPASTASRDGLGPLFQARSCSACHRLDGRGFPPAGPQDEWLGLLVRTTDPRYGPQISPQAIPGATPEAKPQMTWVEVGGKFPDGSAYSLRRPEVSFRDWLAGPIPKETPLSLRLAPAVFGGGLLEGIPLATLQSWADPEDKNADGISGRVHHLPQGGKIGRFGWKANAADIPEQTALAFLHDMGLRTTSHADGDLTAEQARQWAALPNGGSPEVSDLIFRRVVTYLRGLAPPAARPQEPAGKALFQKLQCAACHQPEATTGPNAEFPILANQHFSPFTDLLLHDMGPELADTQPDGDAQPSEWRTAPLWGLGLNEKVSGAAYYLHDGRARNVTEAILWHGGEAAKSKQAFLHLSSVERAQLLRYVDQL